MDLEKFTRRYALVTKRMADASYGSQAHEHYTKIRCEMFNTFYKWGLKAPSYPWLDWQLP